MTGFGRGQIRGASFTATVELKTVNNRFLDVHVRTGAELASIESALRRKISGRLTRGRVDATVSLDRADEVAYEVNEPLVAGFVHALRRVQEQFQVAGEIDINSLARIPGAVQPARSSVTDEMRQGIEAALDLALDELDRMREQEGASLADEIRTRLDEIDNLLPSIEALSGAQTENYRQRLHKRLTDLLSRYQTGTQSDSSAGNSSVVEIDQGRLAQEVAYLAERSDITEEIARLRSHVEQFRQTLKETTEVGKRFDFLLQEFNREANTLLSKSTDVTLKEAGLQLKAGIEKLREQVQNVE